MGWANALGLSNPPAAGGVRLFTANRGGVGFGWPVGSGPGGLIVQPAGRVSAHCVRWATARSGHDPGGA